MDCIGHGVTKSRTGPSDFHFTSSPITDVSHMAVCFSMFWATLLKDKTISHHNLCYIMSLSFFGCSNKLPGKQACCRPWGCRVRHTWATEHHQQTTTDWKAHKNKTKQNSHSSRGWNSELRVQACLVRVLFWVTEFLCPHVVEGAGIFLESLSWGINPITSWHQHLLSGLPTDII